MFELKSAAFGENDWIPVQYSGEGDEISPPLSWSGTPQGAQELALICEDPDVPQPEAFIHWLAYGIDPKSSGDLPEGIPPEDQISTPIRMTQGVNSFRRVGWGGPNPPRKHGPHRYVFRLLALDRKLGLRPDVRKAEFLRAIEGHVIGEARLIGRYQNQESQRKMAA